MIEEATRRRIMIGSLVGAISGLWAGLEGGNVHTGGPGAFVLMVVLFTSALGTCGNAAFWVWAMIKGEETAPYKQPLALYLSALLTPFPFGLLAARFWAG